MPRDHKLYRVEFGIADSEGDQRNWRSQTVVGKDAVEAIRKAKPYKSEYIVQVEFVAVVNRR